MKIGFRGVSSAALLLGIYGGASAAWAQQQQTVTTSQTATQAAPATAVDQTGKAAEAAPGDKVIITGSLIATTPEDAPKPVEVYSAKDLEEQGSPSVSDFVRSLTISSPSDLGFGQSSAEVPTGAGFANADLRGLGSNGTLVLMNGRRLASTNGGFGADLNTVPVEALEAVEVLKDGASSTYGAGAVGGVINFRTRRDINAPQVTLSKQFYDGNDGSYKLDFLTGWAGDASNLLLSLSYDAEDGLMEKDRGFSSLPFAMNPGAYTLTASNPGRFVPVTAGAGTSFVTGTAFTAGAVINDLPGNTGAAAQAACEAIGSEVVNLLQTGNAAAVATNTACALPTYPFRSLVNKSTDARVYAEYNGDITDNMEVHFDFTYNRNQSFVDRIPSDAPSATSTDGSVAAGCATPGCRYVIPVVVNTYTTAGVATATSVRNPFINDFMTRTGTTAAILPDTAALYTATAYRPFLFGGIPGNPDGGLRQERFTRERIMMNSGVKGEFTEGGLFSLLKGIKYDYAAQFNQYNQEFKMPDVFASRLQNALLGYGGPNCNAIDRVATDYSSAAAFNRTVGVQSDIAPGTAGCQWFNPFASAWATSIVNGAANPQFNSGTPTLGAGATARPTGYANPTDLIDWMIGNRTAETVYQSGTMDATFSGQFPDGFQLPGGPIGWAAGGQWRILERRDSSNDPNRVEAAMNVQACPYPDGAVVTSNPGGVNAAPGSAVQGLGQRGCTTATGAFYGAGRIVITQNTPPQYTDSQALATYFELQLPVLDNLNFSVSGRREVFNGGKVDGNIYSVAGKYDLTDNIYFRASYGTNFRAEAALDAVPGSFIDSTSAPTNFSSTGAFVVPVRTTVAGNLNVEDDTTLNVGVGYQGQLFDGRFRASLDFWEIGITGQIATTSQATILSNVFGANTAAGQAARTANNGTAIPAGTVSSLNQFADCSATLISFLSFSTPCVTGVTTANQLTQINLQQVNGPGFITNGLDLSLDYSHPLFDGSLAFNVTATQNLVYKATGYSVGNIVFDTGGHRLGYGNFSRTGNASSRTRANATVRWANHEHNISLRANFTSGYDEEAGTLALRTPIATNTTGNIFSSFGTTNKDYIDYDLNYIYTAPWWKDLTLRLSILNLTDRDPPPLQAVATVAVGAAGYAAGFGDPRGRRIEVGLTKKF